MLNKRSSGFHTNEVPQWKTGISDAGATALTFPVAGVWRWHHPGARDAHRGAVWDNAVWPPNELPRLQVA